MFKDRRSERVERRCEDWEAGIWATASCKRDVLVALECGLGADRGASISRSPSAIIGLRTRLCQCQAKANCLTAFTSQGEYQYCMLWAILICCLWRSDCHNALPPSLQLLLPLEQLQDQSRQKMPFRVDPCCCSCTCADAGAHPRRACVCSASVADARRPHGRPPAIAGVAIISSLRSVQHVL